MQGIILQSTVAGIKKNLHISVEVLCSRYLFSRPVTRQLSSAHMSLTSVFGMGSEGSAASGGRSDPSEWQRSAENKPASLGAVFAGHRNRKQVDPPVLICKKEPPHFCGGFVFALPIFTASRPATIVGAYELNFCVRDGNRWTLIAINTNFFRWLLTILYIQA